MPAFEIAAAMVALALTTQQGTPRQDAGQHATVASRSATASRSSTASRDPERTVQNKRRGTTCGKGLKGYDAKSSTYRDGRGKRQRCTR